MHGKNRKLVLSAATVGLAAFATTASAVGVTYNFDNGQVTGSSGAGTPLVAGTTTGTVGQDNWVLTSGASSVVRTDPVGGFSGNYATSPSVTTTPLDGIMTRVNNANFGYSIGTSTNVVLAMDVLVGPGGPGTTQSRRSQMALGVDLNNDGKIRPTSDALDNAEVGFMWGYEPTGWYLRPAAFGTAVVVAPSVVPSGTWRAQLVVDLAANANNGSGSLYIKQLADTAGNAVSDVFRPVDNAFLNFNLGIQRMATVNGGAAYAANPANWNGMLIRTAGNGGLDNITISTDALNVAPQWAAANGANWQSPSSWYPAIVPGGAGAVAEFGAAISGARTVFTDTPVTVGTLKLNNANTYVLAGAGSLTLQTSSGGASVVVGAGTQKINLPLIVASNTTLDVAAGATLQISDPVTVKAGKSVSQTGGGTVSYESNVTLEAGASLTFGGGTSAHTLALAPTAAATVRAHAGTLNVLQVDSLSLAGSAGAWSAKLDLANNDLIVRHGSLADVVSQLKSAYQNGAWDGTAGIGSSAADATDGTALASADAATLFGLAAGATATFDGQTVDASSLLVKYTWVGDANLDGVVNGADRARLAAVGTTNATWAQGDFDYDGTITGDDYMLFALGAARGTSNITSTVPEPAGLGVIGAGAVALVARRRKGRR
jgi:hypothetical protein